MKKLFVVSVSYELVVYAENEDDARDITSMNISRHVVDTDDSGGEVHEVTSLDQIDPEWHDALPFGIQDDIEHTCAELLEIAKTESSESDPRQEKLSGID